jgi:hypothetical protein
MSTYVAYIDDSGDAFTAVYTALLIPVEQWSQTLAEWLELRKKFYEGYLIPANFELHATDLLAGKGKPAPSLDWGVNSDMGKRKKVLNLSVAAIGRLQHLKIISKVMPHRTPDDCYRALLAEIDSSLEAEGSWAIMIVDGEGRDGTHKRAHRDLAIGSRRIIEDPWFVDSKMSQFVQMADIASFSIFQAHNINPTRQFMWHWMPSFLHDREWTGLCNCPPGAKKAHL